MSSRYRKLQVKIAQAPTVKRAGKRRATFMVKTKLPVHIVRKAVEETERYFDDWRWLPERGVKVHPEFGAPIYTVEVSYRPEGLEDL